MDITIIISISAVTGFISGAVIPLCKPLIDWNIEKKKDTRINQTNLLKNCRLKIDDMYFTLDEFISSSEYSRLKGYLDEDFIKELETGKLNEITISNSKRMDLDKQIKNKLLDKIANLENKWNLI